MRWWQRYLDWRHRHVARLQLERDGFRIRRGTDSRDVRWKEIDSATAFKRDLFTVDLLCLLLLTRDGIVEVDEDMAGFNEVKTAMEAALSIEPAWELDVLFPAFEACPKVLFERDHEAAASSEPRTEGS